MSRSWIMAGHVRSAPAEPHGRPFFTTMVLTDYRAFVDWTLAELAAKRLPRPAIDQVLAERLHPAHGFQLEFGVYSGTTINRIAEADYSRTVWGFDSFEGLPERWRAGYPPGA